MPDLRRVIEEALDHTILIEIPPPVATTENLNILTILSARYVIPRIAFAILFLFLALELKSSQIIQVLI